MRLDSCVHDTWLIAKGTLRVVQGAVLEEGTTVGCGERKHFCHHPRQILGRPRLRKHTRLIPAVGEPLARDVVH